jgi:MoaA/NifB/PqqE/SkfB family radical SAM enzyme
MLPKKLEEYSKAKLMEVVVNSASYMSNERLATMAKAAAKLATSPGIKDKMMKLSELFAQNHPMAQLFHSVANDSSPNCRKKLIHNLFVNWYLLGYGKRKEFSEKHGGVTVPGFMVISPTMACNLHCYGCYSAEYDPNDQLSFEEIDSIISQGKEMGIYFYVISGGEAFIREDILDIFAKHDDCYFLVYTNGTLLQDKLIDRLEELGNVIPCISIEGYSETTDGRRGSGRFKMIMDAMDRMREKGVLFGASCTYTAKTAGIVDSEDFVKLLVEKGAKIIWYFQYIPVGRKPDPELMATPQMRNELRERVKELRKKYPILIGDFWNDGPFVGGCMAAGRQYLHITANGNVEPCVFIHFTADNIREKSLLEVLQGPFFTALRKREAGIKNYLRPCAIIDNPWILREAVKEGGAKPSHVGAETVVGELKETLDQYAEQIHEIYDAAWIEEFQGENEAVDKES